MRHPLERISPGRRGVIFALLLLLTLTFMALFDVVDAPLRTEAAPHGIVSYELAGDVASAEAMLASWGPEARLYAAFGLGLDYLFMVLYSTTIGLACAGMAAVWPERGRWLAAAGILLAWGQWLAAGFDAVENVALLDMLLDGPASPWPGLAAACAAIKFGLILLGLAYALLGAGWFAFGLVRRRVRRQDVV